MLTKWMLAAVIATGLSGWMKTAPQLAAAEVEELPSGEGRSNTVPAPVKPRKVAEAEAAALQNDATTNAPDTAKADEADDDWRFQYGNNHWWYYSKKDQWLVHHNDQWIAPDDDGRYRYRGKSIFNAPATRSQAIASQPTMSYRTPTAYNNRPNVRVNGYYGNGYGPGIYSPGIYGSGLGYPYGAPYYGGSGTRVGVGFGAGGPGVIVGGVSGRSAWGVSIGGGFY